GHPELVEAERLGSGRVPGHALEGGRAGGREREVVVGQRESELQERLETFGILTRMIVRMPILVKPRVKTRPVLVDTQATARRCPPETTRNRPGIDQRSPVQQVQEAQWPADDQPEMP